jgi:hypothetical protein
MRHRRTRRRFAAAGQPWLEMKFLAGVFCILGINSASVGNHANDLGHRIIAGLPIIKSGDRHPRASASGLIGPRPEPTHRIRRSIATAPRLRRWTGMQ